MFPDPLLLFLAVVCVCFYGVKVTTGSSFSLTLSCPRLKDRVWSPRPQKSGPQAHTHNIKKDILNSRQKTARGEAFGVEETATDPNQSASSAHSVYSLDSIFFFGSRVRLQTRKRLRQHLLSSPGPRVLGKEQPEMLRKEAESPLDVRLLPSLLFISSSSQPPKVQEKENFSQQVRSEQEI